jgi:hypothetical protein
MMRAMLAQRRRILRDPATWYLLGGLLLIGLTLWLPWLSAARSTRVELRADHLAAALLEAAAGLPAEPAPGDVEHVLGRLFALAASRGIFAADLEQVDLPGPGVVLCLTNKHYAFQLAASPPDPSARVGRDAVPALEVLAWPRDGLGPGHAVFFHAQNAPRAYTRNLGNAIQGTGPWRAQSREGRPAPGSAQQRQGGLFDGRGSYRSSSEDRWILY